LLKLEAHGVERDAVMGSSQDSHACGSH